MVPITDPKAFIGYRTAPDEWAACHRKTGDCERTTNTQAEAIQTAHAQPEPAP